MFFEKVFYLISKFAQNDFCISLFRGIVLFNRFAQSAGLGLCRPSDDRRNPNEQENKQEHKQTNKETNQQTNKQTNKQTHKQQNDKARETKKETKK